MKTLVAILILVWGGLMIAPILAQSPVPFWHWPTLYDAAENAVVKRGHGADGHSNGFLYFRIGWGPCLAVHYRELQELYNDASKYNYINLRDYADSEFQQRAWNDEHGANCPSPTLEVKPTWRNSRPIYYREYDVTLQKYVKGGKSPYRIRTDGELAECQPYGAYTSTGSQTNYWLLSENADIYTDTEVLKVGDVAEPLMAICHERDMDILDVRWDLP